AQHQFLYGTVESQRGQVESAEKAFRTSLRLDPKCRDCALRLASLQFQTGNLAGANRTYREILAQDPANVEAHYLHGLVLVRQGELKAAKQEMIAVLTLKGDHQDGLNQAAMISMRLHEMKDAAMFVGRAVDANPSALSPF